MALLSAPPLNGKSLDGLVILQNLLLSLIHISEPTRQAEISYAVFCLKKKNIPSSNCLLYTFSSCLFIYNRIVKNMSFSVFFFFNDTATAEISTRSLVGSVRCV